MIARSSRPARVALALGLLAAVSCSSGGAGLNPVTGKVLYNGQPAAGAFVMFYPEASGQAATGTTGDDGVFTLATGSEKGAAAGKYIVTVTVPDPKKKPTPGQLMQGMSDAPDVLGGRFATPDKSTLRAEIKAGENNLQPFDVK